MATALALNPEILILDEPTNNLDPATRREFIEIIKHFDCTKIVAGDDLEMIKEICYRVIIINKGRKIYEGTPREVFNNKELLLQNRSM